MPRPFRHVWLLLSPGAMHSWQIVRGICRYARRNDWLIIVRNPHETTRHDILRAQIDGVIGLIYAPELIDAIYERGLPVVNMTRGHHVDKMNSLLVDDIRCGEMAAEHFLARGFRNFGFLGFPDGKSPFSTIRKQAYAAAVDREQPGTTVHTIDYRSIELVGDYLYGRRADLPPLDWLHALPKPMAVFAMYDPVAFDLAAACQLAGVKVPEDIAILGVHNGQITCEMATPSLSSIDTASEQRGYLAAEMLDRQFRTPDAPVQTRVIPPVGVVSRQSTDIVAVDDPVVVEAVRFIRDHFREGIGVSEIVEAVSVSRRAMERRFLRSLKRTPLDEIHRLRVARALELLATTPLTTDAVARESGYRRRDRMAAAVREATGMAPMAYRALFQADPMLETTEGASA